MKGKLKMYTLMHATESKPVALQNSSTLDCLGLFNGKDIFRRLLRRVWQAECDDFLRSANKCSHLFSRM